MEEKSERTIQKNDEFEVTIDRFGDDAEGIASKENKVIFVPRALPGERVFVHVIQAKKNFAVAKIKELKTQSPLRIEPKCEHYASCGGCDLQHMCYEDGLKFKAEKVQKIFKKFAKIDIKLPKIAKCVNKYRYRNKFSFPARCQNGENVIGLFHKASHMITPVTDCLLQSELAKMVVVAFKKYAEKEKISFYDEHTGLGVIKHLVAREHDDKILITVVVADPNFNNFDEFINILNRAGVVFGLYKNINTKNNNVILGEKEDHIYGIRALDYNEFGIKYSVTNKSFLQVNDEIKKQLYEYVLNKLSNTEVVVDAYSGAGLLSGILASGGHKVYGVEIVKEATESANKLKEKNDLKNMTNINGDCAEILPKLTTEIGDNFAIIVDPPRKGLDARVVDSFLCTEPRQIIYISCDPVTLARDTEQLLKKYRLASLKCFDMFPQTANVETVAEFILKDDYGK